MLRTFAKGTIDDYTRYMQVVRRKKASLCPLRQLANCFALSVTFPQGTQGRLDFITGHFYVSRSTGHSDGTLFRVPVSLASSC